MAHACPDKWLTPHRTGGSAAPEYSESFEVCQRLNHLRGIFAIEIVIGHVVRYDRTFLYPMGKFMIISVAFFFFISAFGMELSFQKKERYLDHFLLPKAGYLLCLAGSIYCINVLADYLLPLELHYFETGRQLAVNFVTKTNWFIWEQIFFYLLFYFVYKYMKKYRVVLIMIITFVLIGIIFKANWTEEYYASALAFPCGLLYGRYYEKCQAILQSIWGRAAAIVMVVAGLSSLLFDESSLLGMVYLKNVMCLAGIMILLITVRYFSFGNKILGFLCKFSAEIYLIQFVFLRTTEALGWNYKIRIPVVLCGTLFSAVMLYPMFTYIKKIMNSISASKRIINNCKMEREQK